MMDSGERSAESESASDSLRRRSVLFSAVADNFSDLEVTAEKHSIRNVSSWPVCGWLWAVRNSVVGCDTAGLWYRIQYWCTGAFPIDFAGLVTLDSVFVQRAPKGGVCPRSFLVS